uniref:Uncharacterized protein n=1 Tax=Rhizophora mucronata TaxID=61149 RepID=A0A2P2QKI2_RHIMU
MRKKHFTQFFVAKFICDSCPGSFLHYQRIKEDKEQSNCLTYPVVVVNFGG